MPNILLIARNRFESKVEQEKCVDIALASDMLYYSCMDSLDIAVLLSGDKDFIPVLEKVRLLSKKVAICSMRSACSLDLSKSEARIRDFDLIWLEDYIHDLYIPLAPEEQQQMQQQTIASNGAGSPFIKLPNEKPGEDKRAWERKVIESIVAQFSSKV